jgi:polyferredoxin
MALMGMPGVGRLKKVKYQLSRYRRTSQVAVLLLLILAPFLRIFGFDLTTTSFWLFGHRFWVAHFVIVSLLVTFAIYVIIAVSVIAGRVFCGWVCPQNTFNELMRTWEHRFGKVGSKLLATAVSLFGGVVVSAYFFDYKRVLLQMQQGDWPVAPVALAVSMGVFFTVAMAFMRTAVCRLACPYGHLQSILTTKKTLRLATFQFSTDICASCGLCAETCHMGVDPREPEQKHCVACGDCLDACQLVSDARKIPRVLNVTFGDPEFQQPLGLKGVNWRNTVKTFLPRLLAPGVAMVLLLGVIAYSVVSRPLVSVSVIRDYTAVQGAGASYGLMRVTVVNLGNVEETFRLTLEGVPADWVHFEQPEVKLAAGQDLVLPLTITPTGGEPGTHEFVLRATGLETGVTGEARAIVYVPH